jgi:hypothetical protein
MTTAPNGELRRQDFHLQVQQFVSLRALQLVPASQAPALYVTSLEDLLATGQRFGCIMADPPWTYDNQGPARVPTTTTPPCP